VPIRESPAQAGFLVGEARARLPVIPRLEAIGKRFRAQPRHERRARPGAMRPAPSVEATACARSPQHVSASPTASTAGSRPQT
jgi:hypothetical protein